MGDPAAREVEAFSDEDHRRATGLLSLLAPGVDRAALPALEPARLRDLYRTMLRVRAVDHAIEALAKEERIGAVPGRRGLEAAVVGAAAALEPDDVIAPGRREAGAALHRGFPLRALLAQLLGNANDLAAGRGAPGYPAFPRALNVLPASAHAATQLPQATGVAWAMKMKRTSHVALAFLDAAETSAEDFHAGLNFAGVYRVPVIFVCINDRPLHPAAATETMSETFAVKALAYGVAGVRVDGGDVFAVLAATRAAAEKARAGGGATLIEAVVGKDDGIARLRAWLAAEKILDDAAEGALSAEVERELREGLAAEKLVGRPPLHRMIEDVYARPPAALEAQLDALEALRDKTVRP
jgi:2-oxoisovalerate dehydrogenase E1 component alpha subunit